MIKIANFNIHIKELKFLTIFSLFLLCEIALGLSIASSHIILLLFFLFPFLIILIPYPLICFLLLIFSFLLEGKPLLNIEGMGIKTFHVILFFTLISYLLQRVSNNEKLFPSHSLNLPIVLILIWMFVSFTWCPSLKNGIGEFLRIGIGLIAFIVCMNVINSIKECNIVINVLITVGFILSAVYLISINFDIGPTYHIYGTTKSFLLGGSNVIGAYLVFISILMLSKVVSAKVFYIRILLIVALVCVLVGIFSVYSRGAVLNFTVGTTIFIFQYLKEKRISTIYILFFLISTSLIFVGILFGELIVEFISSFAVIQKLIKTDIMAMIIHQKGGRVRFWIEGFKMLSANPISYIIGGGVGSFKTMALSTPDVFTYTEMGKTGTYQHAHSLLLAIFFDFGVVGVLLMGYFHIIIVKRVIRAFSVCIDWDNRILLVGFMSALAGLYTHAIVEFSMVEKLIYFLLGIAFVFSNVACPEERLSAVES